MFKYASSDKMEAHSKIIETICKWRNNSQVFLHAYIKLTSSLFVQIVGSAAEEVSRDRRAAASTDMKISIDLSMLNEDLQLLFNDAFKSATQIAKTVLKAFKTLAKSAKSIVQLASRTVQDAVSKLARLQSRVLRVVRKLQMQLTQGLNLGDVLSGIFNSLVRTLQVVTSALTSEKGVLLQLTAVLSF